MTNNSLPYDRADAARSQFTKYQWYDDLSKVWCPFSLHPAYEPCRKVFDPSRSVAASFDDDLAIPSAWIGPAGTYNLVRFVDAFLGRRPDGLHRLVYEKVDNRPELYWEYKRPGRKRRFADPDAAARHAHVSWDHGSLPECCAPRVPEPHVWRALGSETGGFILPEGNPRNYVRRLPWWHDAQDAACLCPDDFPSPHCWLDLDSHESIESGAHVRMS